MTPALQYIGRILWHESPAERQSILADTSPEVFTDPRHLTAFECVRDMVEESGGINVTATIQELTAGLGVDTIELDEVVSQQPVNLNQLRQQLHDLQDRAHHESLYSALHTAIRSMDSGHETSTIEDDLADIRIRHRVDYGSAATTPIQTVVDAFESWAAERAAVQQAGTALKFGLADMDRRALLIPSYGLIAARTSHGKTAFALHLMLGQALAGMHPVLFSLEQPAHMVIGRLVSMIMGVPLRMAMGMDPMTADQDLTKRAALQVIRESNMTILDGRHNIDQIAASANRLRIRGKCDVVYIDQMSRIDHRQRRENKEQAWTRSSNRISELWQELGVPVVLLAQLNRKLQVDHSTPSISHIKDCGSMVEDCCWALLLDRPEADDTRFDALEKKREALEAQGSMDQAWKFNARGAVWITYAKDRNSTMGGTWKRKYRFDANSGRVEEFPESAHRGE